MQTALDTPAAAPRLRWPLRAWLGQGLVVLALAVALLVLVQVTGDNLGARGIRTGFDFLAAKANLSISESWIAFRPGQDSYARVLLVGALNTIFVSAVVIALGTMLGVAVGLARLSANWLLARTAGAFVEVIRNVPLPLQLLLWYQVLLNLPPPRQAIRWGEAVALSNRGLWLPALEWADGHWLPQLRLPVLSGFNFEGGMLLSPELAALVLALTLYAGAFIGEIVRAGILSVPRGQWEAGEALGLTRGQVLRDIVAPLSRRLVIPPLAGEYLNTIKNSSLAVVIGYPELTSLVNTMLSETGQPIEAVALLMLAYLTISLPVSWFMDWYNRRTAVLLR